MRQRVHSVWLILLAGCGFTDAPTDLLERADSAGIEVVRLNRAPADTAHLDVPAIRIGATGLSGAEHEVFEWISDLAPFPDGRLAVVDNRGGRIAVFDSMGAWLHDIGRRGDGPGEHRAPIHASTRGDTLFVYDALQRRLSRYTAAGAFLGSIVLAQRSSALPFAAVGDGYILEVESGQLMDPEPARGALVRVDLGGEGADTLVGPYPVPETGWEITDEATGMGRMVNPPALAVYPPWTTRSRDSARAHDAC